MENKNDILLIGIIFPDIDKYLIAYCNSIQFQDTNAFDILILNDRYTETFPLIDKRINIINIKSNLTPAEIRMQGIQYALKNKYKYVVFSDADDYFSRNRISLSKEKLLKYDFAYNELDLINESEILIEKSYYNKLKIKDEYNSYLNIIDKNIFGLGNTAVKIDRLKDLYIPKEIIAVDWWIFSILLLERYVGGFVKDAITYYRQYTNNSIGMGKKLNETVLLKGIKVKKVHYKHLVLYCKKRNLKEAIEIYNHKLSDINELNKYIQDDNFRRKYIEIINKNYNKIFNGWWSDILPMDVWRKYDE